MSCGHGTTVVPPLALHSVCVCVRAHRHDKWLIFDLGEERPLLGLSVMVHGVQRTDRQHDFIRRLAVRSVFFPCSVETNRHMNGW